MILLVQLLPPLNGRVFLITIKLIMAMEKKTEEIKVHVTESMKRKIQDASMDDDRRVSDWMTHNIALILTLRDAGISLTCCKNCSRDE